VLMDDAKARASSEMAGLKPIGTLWLILKAVKNHLLKPLGVVMHGAEYTYRLRAGDYRIIN